MRRCSVVIPTYNNAKVLPATLSALGRQHIPDGWQVEVIASDDGSHDNSVAVARGFKSKHIDTTVVEHSHTGAAGARNRGMAISSGDIILFLGADIVLRPKTLMYHLRFHERKTKKEEAALGFVQWDPALPPTAFMEWLSHGGPQNDYDSLLGVAWTDPRHYFYGSHISTKRALVESIPWPEEYEAYGWEDLDYGRTLAAAGMRLAVLHNAVGLHHHRLSAQEVVKRQQRSAENLHLYQRRFPEAPVSSAQSLRGALLQMLYVLSGLRGALPPLVNGRILTHPWVYGWIIRDAFWRGFRHNSGRKIPKKP